LLSNSASERLLGYERFEFSMILEKKKKKKKKKKKSLKVKETTIPRPSPLA